MINIVGVSGSLRKNSFNAGLLRSAVDAAPAHCTLTMNTIRGIPLYDGDIEETAGIPDKVSDLKERIAAADGLLIVTPEYNNSLPGVFKNAIDWLSRPPADRPKVFGNLPVGIIGTTPGNFGTAFSQYAWLQVFRVLGAQVWSGQLLWVSGAMGKFDQEGNLHDEKTRTKLTRYLEGFTAFIHHINNE